MYGKASNFFIFGWRVTFKLKTRNFYEILSGYLNLFVFSDRWIFIKKYIPQN